MKSVRVEPLGGNVLLIRVECDCGETVLLEPAMGQESYHHSIPMSECEEVKKLLCRCGKKYTLKVQESHVYVFSH